MPIRHNIKVKRVNRKLNSKEVQKNRFAVQFGDGALNKGDKNLHFKIDKVYER